MTKRSLAILDASLGRVSNSDVLLSFGCDERPWVNEGAPLIVDGGYTAK